MQERVRQHKEPQMNEGDGKAIRHGNKRLDYIEWTTTGLLKRLGQEAGSGEGSYTELWKRNKQKCQS